jgi:hypothetical protein
LSEGSDGFLAGLCPSRKSANAIGHRIELPAIITQKAIFIFWADSADMGKGKRA